MSNSLVSLLVVVSTFPCYIVCWPAVISSGASWARHGLMLGMLAAGTLVGMLLTFMFTVDMLKSRPSVQLSELKAKQIGIVAAIMFLMLPTFFITDVVGRPYFMYGDTDADTVSVIVADDYQDCEAQQLLSGMCPRQGRAAPGNYLLFDPDTWVINIGPGLPTTTLKSSYCYAPTSVEYRMLGALQNLTYPEQPFCDPASNGVLEGYSRQLRTHLRDMEVLGRRGSDFLDEEILIDGDRWTELFELSLRLSAVAAGLLLMDVSSNAVEFIMDLSDLIDMFILGAYVEVAQLNGGHRPLTMVNVMGLPWPQACFACVLVSYVSVCIRLGLSMCEKRASRDRENNAEQGYSGTLVDHVLSFLCTELPFIVLRLVAWCHSVPVSLLLLKNLQCGFKDLNALRNAVGRRQRQAAAP